MNSKTKIVSIVLFLSVFIMLVSFGEQKAEWKGKIEKENGIKVIKNPREPLYDEIEFELEEDLSIGREDDGNYMFYSRVSLAVDNQDNIYALDGRNCRIQKYDKNGQYLQTIVTCPPDIGPGVVLKLSWTKGVGYGQETLHTGADHQHAP